MKVILAGLILFVGTCAIAPDIYAADPQVCWKSTYGRGAGAVPTSCDFNNLEKSGALCYPKCASGYSGVASGCWQNCPGGFRDDGAYCFKPKAYGRGVGYPWKFGDPAFDYSKAEARCKKANKQGCEKNGLIWYPKCKSGFKPAGSNICSPTCPSGMTDIGVSCQKKSYLRQTVTPRCSSSQQADAGLCYSKCRATFEGVGPVCWQQCPRSHPYQCGALCGQSKYDCDSAVIEQVISTIDVAVNIALAASTAGAGNAAKQGAKIAVLRALKLTYNSIGKKATREFVELAFTQLGKIAGEVAAKETAKGAAKKWSEISVKLVATNDLRSIADSFDLEDLDPTGVASLVKAYNKPICGLRQVFGSAAVVYPGNLYLVNSRGQLLYYRHNAKGTFVIDGKVIGTADWEKAKYIAAARIPGSGGALYYVKQNGDLLYYEHDLNGNWRIAGQKIGAGWGNFIHFMVARKGLLYAVEPNGNLRVYRHDNNLKFTLNKVIGNGWALPRVISGGANAFYVVNSDGLLRYYYHDDNYNWRHANQVIGNGWNFRYLSSSGNGSLYAVSGSGSLLFYRHNNAKVFLAGSGNAIGFGWGSPGKYGVIVGQY